MTDPPKDPYAPDSSGPTQRPVSHDSSIEHEPQFSYQPFAADPSEETAGSGLDPIGGPRSAEERVEHSVWDEPGLSPQLSGQRPQSAVTYADWLAEGMRKTTDARSAKICLLVALLAGPWSILGTFVGSFGGRSGGGLIAICILGPLLEEVMKAAGILWIVEKRPYYFKSARQILLCAAMSGLWFAVIENVIYLNVYISNPSAEIILWRWTVCVLLHVSCTFLAGIGLSRVWRQSMETRERPQISLASNFIVGAVVFHAIYNTAMVVVTAARELV